MRNYWKITLALAVAVTVATAPVWAQDAPAGWKTQAREGGARTFTPPDLRAGESYSVTLYDAAPLGGKSLESWLRAFAGPVGAKAGQLAAALKIEVTEGKVVSGTGAYNGPNGTSLLAVFVAFSSDNGATIHVARTLSSPKSEVWERYQSGNTAIVKALLQRTKNEQNKSQSALVASGVPESIAENLTLGIALVPGVYAGTQFKSGMFGSRSTVGLRVYLYANGEYRICDRNDQDFDLGGPVVGKIKFDRARGMIDIKEYFALSNDNFKPDRTYCYYGRNSEGKPVIYGRSSVGAMTSEGYTLLIWEGPPTGRKSQSEEDAPARALEAQKQAAQDKLNRIQTRVAPGKGVPAAQIAAVVHNFDSQLRQTMVSPGGSYIIPNFGGLATYGYNAPIYGMEHDITNDTYLLLRDGTIHRGLEWAPDQFDVAASKRKEPKNWGLWKSEGGKLQMSFAGEPYEEVPGKRVAPNAAQTRLSGRYKTEGKSIAFTPQGRFTRSALDPKNDPSAKYTLAKAQKTVAGGDVAGAYSLSGYALTLRYDNGKIERMLFFASATRDAIWFEGDWIEIDKGK